MAGEQQRSPQGSEALRANGLTAQQQRFCVEYLVDLNGAAAARRAGYSPDQAQSNAAAMMDMELIQKNLRRLMRRRERNYELTGERVLKELTKVAFSDIRDLFDDNGNMVPMNELDDNIAPAVASIKVKERTGKNGDTEIEKEIRLWDKPKGLELLGKHFKLYTDLIEAKVDTMTDEEAAERALQLVKLGQARALGSKQRALAAEQVVEVAPEAPPEAG